MTRIETLQELLERVEAGDNPHDGDEPFTGAEMATLAHALDQVAPDDLVIYWRGPVGLAPRTLREAAATLSERGLCLLTQRIVEAPMDETRLAEYIAVKAKPRVVTR